MSDRVGEARIVDEFMAADKTRKITEKIEIANGGRRQRRKYVERERADKYDRRIIRVHATTLIQYYYYFVVSRAHCRVWQKHARALRARASGATATYERAAADDVTAAVVGIAPVAAAAVTSFTLNAIAYAGRSLTRHTDADIIP